MGQPVVHSRRRSRGRRASAASGPSGPHEVPGTNIVLGQFKDPEGRVIGVIKG